MSNQADTAIAYALAQVGKPYVFGASGPNAYDCSGLVMAAYAQAGITLPHSTYLMVNLGTAVDPAQIQPGDLRFPEAGHVQLYLGGGNIVEAPTAGENVRVVKAWGDSWRVRRVAAEPGTGASIPTGSSPNTIPTISASPINAISDVTGALGHIGDALGFLIDPHNWLRALMFLAGIALVLFAVYRLSEGTA